MHMHSKSNCDKLLKIAYGNEEKINKDDMLYYPSTVLTFIHKIKCLAICFNKFTNINSSSEMPYDL